MSNIMNPCSETLDPGSPISRTPMASRMTELYMTFRLYLVGLHLAQLTHDDGTL
ncbi:hypothetical protein IMCC21906_02423 [Spongiibacter sp. IMCC21906]|nr:hypothetical protein IMCC21906_02423 [Spongiibacter sp. IMCC21906]